MSIVAVCCGWWPALKRAGVKRLKFHALRHTAAALAIASGAHPKAIQMRLGHHSAAFTLDTYGGLFEGMDRDLADRLERFGPDEPKKSERGGKIIEFKRRKAP